MYAGNTLQQHDTEAWGTSCKPTGVSHRHTWTTETEKSSSDQIQQGTTAVQTHRWRQHTDLEGLLKTVRDTDVYTHWNTHTHAQFLTKMAVKFCKFYLCWCINHTQIDVLCGSILPKSKSFSSVGKTFILKEWYVNSSMVDTVERDYNHQCIDRNYFFFHMS